MRTEAHLFTGVAVFFAVTAAGYGWFSEEPAARPSWPSPS